MRSRTKAAQPEDIQRRNTWLFLALGLANLAMMALR